MNWTEISTLYRFELRSALRDRTIVINSIVLPLVLYPALLWVMFTGISFVRGQTDDMASRVAVLAAPGLQVEIEPRLREAKRVEVTTAPRDEADAERQVRGGTLDAGLVLEPDAALTNNFRARLIYDGSRERSDLARRRVTDVVAAYRERRLRDEARARGIDAARLGGLRDRAQEHREQPRHGCVPARHPPAHPLRRHGRARVPQPRDRHDGRRARAQHLGNADDDGGQSDEHRRAPSTSTVTTLGGLAGLLNVVAMLLTMRGIVAPLLGREESAHGVRACRSPRVPVLLVGAVLLAGLPGRRHDAARRVRAHVPRGTVDGDAASTWRRWCPAMFLSTPGIHLTLPLALVPVVNIALVVREAISGTRQAAGNSGGRALATLAVIVASSWRLARYVLACENVVVGSYSGSLVTFLKRARDDRPQARDHDDTCGSRTDSRRSSRTRAAAASARWTASTSSAAPARFSACSAPTAPARRRRCGCWRRCWCRPSGTRAGHGSRRRAAPEQVRRHTRASSRRARRCTRDSPAARRSSSSRGSTATRRPAARACGAARRAVRDHRLRRHARRPAVAGHEAEGLHRADDRARPAGADLRRADRRPRRAQRARDAARDRGAPRTRARRSSSRRTS